MRLVVITSSLAPATFTNEEGVSLSIAAVSSTGRRTKEISYHTTKAVELRAAIAKRNILANRDSLNEQRAINKGKPYECNKEGVFQDAADIHPPEYDKKQATYNNRLREALGYSKNYQQTKLLLGLISYLAPEDERSIDQLYKSYCAHLKEMGRKKIIPAKKKEQKKEENKPTAPKLSATYSNGMPRINRVSYRADKELYVVSMITDDGKVVKTTRDYNKAIELRDELLAIKNKSL